MSEAINEIEGAMMRLRNKTPQNVLHMKMGDLRKAEARTFSDLSKTINVTTHNGTSVSTLTSLSVIAEEMRKSKKGGQSHDEGNIFLFLE